MEDWTTAVDPDRLSVWMDQQGLGRGEISNASVLGGGTQNILLKFDRDDCTFVLRRPPLHPRKNSNDTMRREMRMLKALADTPVPHPRLILGCPEEDVLGVAFYLMEPVEGFAPTTGLPALHSGSPDIRRRMGLALVEGITALGAVDHRAVGLEGFGNADNYLGRQVSRWKAQMESYHDFPGWPGPRSIPGVEKVANWLDRHRPETFDPGIIHGDYHFGNVMYRHDGPELAAIVDWELTTIGDPLLDLGWLLATWPVDGMSTVETLKVNPWDGFPSSGELIEHYRARTTRNVDSIDWYAVLACYKLAIILEGTHARACAGKATKESGDLLHASTINLFERALSWIR
ncbi:phosphotransferase family protein [Alcanivorax sp. ZXX171]|nr:phosphotransferase family protein [Alcanivorax sp. ZXX171]